MSHVLGQLRQVKARSRLPQGEEPLVHWKSWGGAWLTRPYQPPQPHDPSPHVPKHRILPHGSLTPPPAGGAGPLTHLTVHPPELSSEATGCHQGTWTPITYLISSININGQHLTFHRLLMGLSPMRTGTISDPFAAVPPGHSTVPGT